MTATAQFLCLGDTDYAIDFISRHGQRQESNAKPFFLYLAYNAVHSPWQAKKADEAKYAHLPNEPLRLYAAMLASLDDNIGRVPPAERQARRAEAG